MKQLNLIDKINREFHGGALIVGKRKCARPLCTRKPIHLVLKANKQVNLFKNSRVIKGAIHKYAALCGIKIYSLGVQADHIHLCVRIHDRNLYKKFIRSLTGVLARRFGKGLWKLLPFTRVGQWGKGFAILKNYVQLNELEINGVVPYQKRKDYYRRYKVEPPKIIMTV